MCVDSGNTDSKVSTFSWPHNFCSKQGLGFGLFLCRWKEDVPVVRKNIYQAAHLLAPTGPGRSEDFFWSVNGERIMITVESILLLRARMSDSELATTLLLLLLCICCCCCWQSTICEQSLPGRSMDVYKKRRQQTRCFLNCCSAVKKNIHHPDYSSVRRLIRRTERRICSKSSISSSTRSYYDSVGLVASR